jgi:hypothetical protein
MMWETPQSSISDLPDALLARVLGLVPSRLCLLLVCKRWLHVALHDMPELWEVVHVDGGRVSKLLSRGTPADARRGLVRGFHQQAAQLRDLRIHCDDNAGSFAALVPQLLQHLAGLDELQALTLEVKFATQLQWRSALQASRRPASCFPMRRPR